MLVEDILAHTHPAHEDARATGGLRSVLAQLELAEMEAVLVDLDEDENSLDDLDEPATAVPFLKQEFVKKESGYNTGGAASSSSSCSIGPTPKRQGAAKAKNAARPGAPVKRDYTQ